MKRFFWFHFFATLLTFAQIAVAKDMPLLFPILVNEIYQGEVRALPSANTNETKLKIEDLINIGGVRLSAEDRLQLEDLQSINEYVSVEGLQKKGLSIQFDLNLLRVLWILDPSKQSVQGMMEGQTSLNGLRVEPEPWSFLFNVRASQNIYSPDFDNKYRKDSISGDHDFALRMRDLVIEGYFKTTEGTAEIYRQDVRGVYDLPETNRRYSFGDLQYTLLGDQVFQPILGLGIQKNPAIGWSSVAQSISGKEIVLNRFSLVEIYINGVLYRSQRLGPGRFSINDLPVVAGYNQVDVVVTDENGESQKLQFPYLSEESLLQKGESRFSYNIGKLGYDKVGTGREYKDKSAFSFNHSLGVSEVLTASFWGQGDSSQKVGGLEGIWGHRWGLFSFEFNGSEIENDKTQMASSARYRSPISNSDWLWSYGLGLEYKELRYSTWGELNPYQRYELQTDVFLSFSPWYRHRLTVGGQFAEDRFGLRNRENIYGVYSLSPFKNTQLSFELTQRQDAQIKENTFFVYLNWIESQKNVQVFTSYQKMNEEFRSNLIWEPPRKDSVWGVNALVRSNEASEGVALESKYRGSAINIGLLGDWSHAKKSSQSTSQTYRWSLGTALVASPKTFAFSRPVTDSALVIRDSSESKGRISVSAIEDLIGEDVLSRNQLILPELNSYRSLAFKVELEGGAQYSKLLNDHFVVFPTYRSLVLVELATMGQVVVKAQIIDESGKPKALSAGRVLNSQGVETSGFFTDREGQVYLDGITVGRWQLEFYDESETKVYFEVPEGAQGELQLGALKAVGRR